MARSMSFVARAFAATTVLAALTSGTALAAAPPAPAAQQNVITNEAKIKAARLAGFAESEFSRLLVFSDRNFVYELWRRAADNEKAANVRQAALLAYQTNTPEALAQFVNTGIHQAHEQDLAAEAARQAERALRIKAAAVIGVTPTESMLLVDRKNFLFRLWEACPKEFTEVREAALVAYRGSAEQEQEFLTTGVVAAKQAADERIAKEAKEKEEAEKERLRVREARTKALAVINVPATEALLGMPERSFVFEVYQAAPQLSQVAGAALEALHSEEPGALRHYVFTGIHQAHAKDLAEAAAKQDQANQRKILEMVTHAENTGVSPLLVTAGKEALAAGPAERAAFLARDRAPLLRQSFHATSPGLSGSPFLRHFNGVASISPITGELDRQDATWMLVPGLADPDCYSIESVNFRGSFLRHRDFRISLAGNDNTELFAKDATFCARKGRTGADVSFESVNLPGRFLRHSDGGIYLADNSNRFPFDNPHLFAEDATWQVTPPWVS
ncbi:MULTISPECIES: AbfB domain-containing protein [unclassified Crossiella]|uniref:AbfB domain-containing protein n=1 Tax=unclassified Crossiella TaxID=2620835 RepID=UPI001FFF2E47|nr:MULTISPECIES: AbfB domain-containing protein [unclassified Crossiella]MCK2240221.1 AbfB domain-containing protein [Crossiella sp. S99.2]MCK2253327.1 AbfB domain-containing protein [Crossiella sp. S99.1]